LRPPPFRALDLRALDLRDDPLLAFREERLRPLLLRALELFLPRLREDFRPPLLRLLLRLRELPLLRPDDAERERFLPPLERLDFLAAAIAKLHSRGVRYLA
jgi:hypothetical protein